MTTTVLYVSDVTLWLARTHTYCSHCYMPASFMVTITSPCQPPSPLNVDDGDPAAAADDDVESDDPRGPDTNKDTHRVHQPIIVCER